MRSRLVKQPQRERVLPKRPRRERVLPTEASPWMKMGKPITRCLLESGRGRIRTHRRLREAVKKSHRQEAGGKRKQQEVKKVTVVQSL